MGVRRELDIHHEIAASQGGGLQEMWKDIDSISLTIRQLMGSASRERRITSNNKRKER